MKRCSSIPSCLRLFPGATTTSAAVRWVSFDPKHTKPITVRQQNGRQSFLPEAQQMPRMKQTLGGLAHSFGRQTALRLPKQRGALPTRQRDEAFRQKVAAWQPVVKLIPDEHLRVAFVGRMNAGKSSLWNKLKTDVSIAQQKVKDVEGYTRDCVEAVGKIGAGLYMTMIDTPGAAGGCLVEEAQKAIETADVAVFVTAADAELTNDELEVIKMLHRKRIPTLLLVNKMDLLQGLGLEADVERERLLETYKEVGFGNPIPYSVNRDEGDDLLSAALQPFYDLNIMERTIGDWNLEDLASEGDAKAMERIRERNLSSRFIRVAVIGRPNCGKSTLLNRLVGYERSRAADERGTTRDSVEVNCVYRGKRLKLIDTAGVLKLKSQKRNVEWRDHWHITKKVIDYAQVVIVCFDAREGVPSNGDMQLCHRAVEEGRPFVLAANKWDAVLDPPATAEAIDYRLKKQIHEVRYASAVVVSGQNGTNLNLMLDEVLDLHDKWGMQIHSGHLNRFWKRFERTVSIPTKVTRVMKLKQVNVRPPCFKLFLQTRNPGDILKGAYENMVRNALIEEFGLKGIPIRIIQETKTAHPDYI